MKGFLWAMFTSEGLTCGDQRDFGGKHTQELPLWDLHLLKSPQHRNLVCLIGQTEGILPKAGMPYQYSASMEIMVLHCLCLD